MKRWLDFTSGARVTIEAPDMARGDAAFEHIVELLEIALGEARLRRDQFAQRALERLTHCHCGQAWPCLEHA